MTRIEANTGMKHKLHQVTVHGVTDLFQSKSWRQTISWAFVLLIAAFFMAVEVKNVFQDYWSQPFIVKVTQEHLYSQRVPDTTVCPVTPLDTDKLRAYNFSEGEIAQLHAVFTPDYYTVPSGWYVTTESSHDPESKIKAMGLDWEGFLDEFGVACGHMLHNCMNNWVFFNCCSETQVVYHRYFGKCYSFRNLDRVGRNQTAPFHFGGLVIMAETKRPKRADLFGAITSGLAVEISHRYEFNTYEIIPIAENEMTEIRLTAQHYTRHPDREGGCLNRNNWVTRMTPHFCWNKGVIEQCQCSLAGYFKHRNVSLCFPQEYNECEKDAVTEYQTGCIAELAKPSCNEWIYPSSILRSNLDLNNYFHTQAEYGFSKPTFLAGPRALEEGKNYSVITVYYSQMGFTDHSEVPSYSIDRFISSIGGHLSLFMGASLISLVQLLVYLPSLCFKKKEDEVTPVEEIVAPRPSINA